MRIAKALGFFVALSTLPAAALAQTPLQDLDLGDDNADERRLEVIQNRKYDLLNELTLQLGVLPGDAFYKGLTGTVGYTLHLGQSVAWEIAQFTYSKNFDSNLKNEVIRIALSSGRIPPQFPEIQWIAASHLVLKPLYGKEAAFNTNVVHLEVFAQAGPAFVKTTNIRASMPVVGLNFGFDAGMGLRLWLSPVVSLRLDLGYLGYWSQRGRLGPDRIRDPNDRELYYIQAVHMRFGFAFNLRGDA